MGHGKEKNQDFAYCKLAYYKKHTHFFSWPWEKKTVHVDLLYYGNLKTVTDILLTQELQIFALLSCSIRG